MGLRDIPLKEEYRSDRDDIVSEFFFPCLNGCVRYDRCIEYVSLKSLITLSLGFGGAGRDGARLRIVCGHRFGAADLEAISRLFGGGGLARRAGTIMDAKVRMLQGIVDGGQVEIRIAVPGSEEVVGSFSERIGIFTDERGDSVAFTGTSNRTFDTEGRDFESVDVFTSWGDASRVRTKAADFEDLWNDRTRHVRVYGFAHAEGHNMLKYSHEWAVED